MKSRHLAALGLAALALLACRETRKPVILTAQQEALLAAKADVALAQIVRDNPESPLAVIAAFRTDVYLYQSAMLERRNIPVLDVMDNAAVLRLTPPEVIPLLGERSLVRASYFCSQGGLARIHPIFLMEIMKSYGKGRDGKDHFILVRFRDAIVEGDLQAVKAAGFSVTSREDPYLHLKGPLTGLPPLIDGGRIAFFESEPPGASPPTGD